MAFITPAQLQGPIALLTRGPIPRRGPRAGPDTHVRREVGLGNLAFTRLGMNSVIHN